MLIQIRLRDNLTRRARKILNELAPLEARRLGYRYPVTDHVALAMLRAKNSQFGRELVVSTIFDHFHVDTRNLANRVEGWLLVAIGNHESLPGSQSMAPQVKRAAAEEARRLRESYVGSEHILLACLNDRESRARQELEALGITHRSTTTLLSYLHGS
jgi:ATP-dependent Clp protease ATP-binding subunit ClpC